MIRGKNNSGECETKPCFSQYINIASTKATR